MVTELPLIQTQIQIYRPLSSQPLFFYYLVEYPLFLMTAVASISPGFRTISRKFPDPNSGDLLAQILLTAPLVTPRCFSSMTNSLQHHGNPVPSLE